MNEHEKFFNEIDNKIGTYHMFYGKKQTVLIVSEDYRCVQTGYGNFGNVTEYLGLRVVFTARDVIDVF